MNHKIILPDYPRTQHLPYKPNAVRDDLVASDKDVEVLFNSPHIYWEEKVDGSSCGMCLYEDHPLIRNRNHILNKGFLKRTPAKMQFSSVWNFFYNNKDKFEKLNKEMGFPAAVYGEWMYALHGIRYDLLPAYFIAYDLYDWQRGYFVDPGFGRRMLEQVGFNVPPLLHKGSLDNWEQLDKFSYEKSPFSSVDQREGVYVKVSDGEKIVSRFKLVREDFIQGCRWDKNKITRNRLISR